MFVEFLDIRVEFLANQLPAVIDNAKVRSLDYCWSLPADRHRADQPSPG